MIGTKIILLSFLSFVVTSNVFAQSFLEDYFMGNKDSLIAEATKLINMPEPKFRFNTPSNTDPAVIADIGFEQVYQAENHYFITRDGKKLFAYNFLANAQNTIILLHGVASSAYLYNKTAGLLQEATQAEIFAVDLRGHGQSEGLPGDVDFINQYAEDLTDIINAIKKKKPKGKIILAGHSMGGGIILQYVEKTDADNIDGILLFAPLIGQNSPAFKQEESIENEHEDPFIKIHLSRIIGLKMLNEIGNHQQDNLPVLFFNLPENMPLRKYTYRANESMAPADYKRGLQAVKSPLLVLIGSKDEAFDAEKLQQAFLENTQAEVSIIQNASHNGVRHRPQTYEMIKQWFSKL